MFDIRTAPIEELLDDRATSEGDIAICQLALLHGHVTYSGGSVQQRLDRNRSIIATIDEELARRKEAA